MNTWLVLSKLMGIVRRGFLKELEVSDFLWSRFLIIKQNVNMATNAILNSGLTPEATAVRRTMPPHCACRCYCLPFLRTSTLLSYPRRPSSDRATSFVSLRCATCIT